METSSAQYGAADYRERIQKLIEGYTPSTTAKCPVKLAVTLKDQKPVVSRPRRLSPGNEEDARRQLEDWEARRIVRQGSSDYARPIVITRKKDETIKICIDYKRLNKVVDRLHHPMPLIEDTLDGTEGSLIS